MNFKYLKKQLSGELYLGDEILSIYATDASAYREKPKAVIIPKNEDDIKKLIHFASKHQVALIPRAAGTSLAGQVVGGGIIVDVSKYFTQLMELNLEENWVRVQPGLVRDDLNARLSQYHIFFAPETSTSNRATIGGMIANNSCGSNSVVYGSTREHLLELEVFLSDGSKVHFGPVNGDNFPQKGLEGKLYRAIHQMLGDVQTREQIAREYPKASIPRRNTGYALDLLAGMYPFNPNGVPFNFCSLLAGSEGTLAFITAAKLKLMPILYEPKRMVCIHCNHVEQALFANLVALKYAPQSCELIDQYVLEATQRNRTQNQNRFFVKGNPQAILMVEIIRKSKGEVEKAVAEMIAELTTQKLGYAFPVLEGTDIKKALELRKSGLGLLSNIPGDHKPVPVIEDTAVDVQQLPSYIAAFNKILHKYDLHSVHYAHAGSGELHLRPILNLKTDDGLRLFRKMAEEIAVLVKKYQGSLSGEHGDGRLRGEFIPYMIGEKNYQLLKKIKYTWDPHHIFNPGKITNTPPMDTFLRYKKNQQTKNLETIFDFSDHQGIIRSAELCNGSAVCRKSEITGGTMCPSYMATRNEQDTTRARANVLREFLSNSSKKNPFDHPEIEKIMDLCLSCKGCKSECPSNVDIAKLKAEWQHHYYQSHAMKAIKAKMIANFPKAMNMLRAAPWVFNTLRNVTKPILGISHKRSIPKIANETLLTWFHNSFRPKTKSSRHKLYFFFDEFTNSQDTEIGKKAIILLDRLGYKILHTPHQPSGRTYLSSGFLKEARQIALTNVHTFHPLVSPSIPLIGIEPSAILSFVDEYPALLRGTDQQKSKDLAKSTFTIEDFLYREIQNGNIGVSDFSQDKKNILLHVHCHQKALLPTTPLVRLLSTPENYSVKVIPSGCCGMAGFFGYQKKYYKVSMKIGELVLFPQIRNAEKQTCVVASGTSCRHQIIDGTGRKAQHPVEIL